MTGLRLRSTLKEGTQGGAKSEIKLTGCMAALDAQRFLEQQ